MLMDECKRVSTESQNLKLDLSNKFQGAIKDVTNKLEEQRDDSLTQLKENEMLRTQLKQKEEHNALTIQQYTQQLKQKSLELQIADLKTQQHEEKLVKEQSQMKMYAEQVSQLLATEKNLRLQLTADGEKFQQFQDPLVKSNEVFETFKQEIEMMAKSIKELKKENTFLKGKTKKSDITLIQLVEEVLTCGSNVGAPVSWGKNVPDRSSFYSVYVYYRLLTMTKGSKNSGYSASKSVAKVGYISSVPVKTTVTFKGGKGGGEGSYVNKSRITYADKQTGCYGRATMKEKASAGEFHWKNGTSGTKSEYKKSSTVRIGDKSGYMEVYNEQTVRNVSYNKSSDNKNFITYDNGDGGEYGGYGYIG
ncbi:hypothetical protein L2E82_12217 [Cichorium intybus]|uniref:Uncharacterized protein n=1 Tax=Cichorium intybus TaxID=13427 RepID=A0ACB9GFB6_CICIN|nr:hypothetical protein L2E82_12217 [Cichorium intybus]